MIGCDQHSLVTTVEGPCCHSVVKESTDSDDSDASDDTISGAEVQL